MVDLREAANARVDVVFDEIQAAIGMVPNFFKMQAEADPQWLELNWNRWKVIIGQQRSLDRKTKELIMVAVSIAKNCPYCSLAHKAAALAAGATKQELLEAMQVVELASSFTTIADALQIPCDVMPARPQLATP